MGIVSRPERLPRGESGDVDLVRRLRGGNRSALVQLYDRFRRPAFTLARRILADDGLAEDVLQEVFLGLWRDPGAFDRAPGTFTAWLMAAVHHTAVDAVRREESHRRRRARAEAEFGLAAPAADRDVEEAVRRVASGRVREALGQLPDAQREALALAYYGGYTQREVAALTGTPLGTVRTRMLAGMRRLREELRGVGSGVPHGGALDGSGR
jgi:RNA polymerase sigma factor (sigma-70 family)